MWGVDDGQMAAVPDMSQGIWNPPAYGGMAPRAQAPYGGGGSGVQQPPRKPWDSGSGAQQWPLQSWQGGPPPPQWVQPPPPANGKPQYFDRAPSIPPQYGMGAPRMPGGQEQWMAQKDWQRNDGGAGGHWGDPSGGHASVSHWGGGGQTPAMPPNHDLSGTAHWAQQRAQQQSGQWGAPPPMHAPPPHHRPPPPQAMQQWNPPPQMSHAGHDSFRAQQQTPQSWDMNPQNPSMWVPPAPNDIKDDMMWHDPNPRQKKVLQSDKGTGAWGDPHLQGDIKRWKPPTESAEASDWQSAAPAVPSTSNIENQPPVLGWGEPLNAGQDGTATPAQWKSTAERPQKVGSSNWQVPKSSRYAGDEQPMDGKQPEFAAAAMAAMQDQASSLPSNGGQRVDLGALTQQIADQLRVAVQKRLIDVSVLNQPLPKDTLFLLNNLLQRVPRMEAAQKELQSSQLANPSPNEQQHGEMQRLQTEITQLQGEIREYQAKINNTAQTPDPNSRIHRWTQPSLSTDNGEEAIADNPWAASSLGGAEWAPPTTATSGGDDAKADGGVQEFIPGRPWNYHDPATDPTATPGGMVARAFNAFGGVAMSPSSTQDMWAGMGSRPDSSTGQRVGTFWLVLTGVQPERVATVAGACQEAGKAVSTMQAVKPNGTMFVCKYAADVPSEQVVQRLSSLGVQVTLANEAEVEALMTAGSRWPQGAAGEYRPSAQTYGIESTWANPVQSTFH